MSSPGFPAFHAGFFSVPRWAWYKYDETKYRPDLRYSGYLKKGVKGVMIEFEESFENVLLTDFDEWHLVLNSHNEEEIKNEK